MYLYVLICIFVTTVSTLTDIKFSQFKTLSLINSTERQDRRYQRYIIFENKLSTHRSTFDKHKLE